MVYYFMSVCLGFSCRPNSGWFGQRLTMSSEWVDSNPNMPLREVLCLNRHTRSFVSSLKSLPHTQKICTHWETSCLQGTTGAIASADDTQTHSVETSGTANNSPATKRLQPSRTNSFFKRAERGRMDVAQVGKKICGSKVSLCHCIIVGTASPSDEAHELSHATGGQIPFYFIPIISSQEQVSKQPDFFSTGLSATTISEQMLVLSDAS